MKSSFMATRPIDSERAENGDGVHSPSRYKAPHLPLRDGDGYRCRRCSMRSDWPGWRSGCHATSNFAPPSTARAARRGYAVGDEIATGLVITKSDPGRRRFELRCTFCEATGSVSQSTVSGYAHGRVVPTWCRCDETADERTNARRRQEPMAARRAQRSSEQRPRAEVPPLRDWPPPLRLKRLEIGDLVGDRYIVEDRFRDAAALALRCVECRARGIASCQAVSLYRRYGLRPRWCTCPKEGDEHAAE